MKEYKLAVNIRMVMILFAMIMVAAIMPQDVYGEPVSSIRLWKGESIADLTADNPYYVNGEAKSEGTLGNGACTAHFDASTGTLTLNGYNDGRILTSDSANPGDVNIILQGANIIENGDIEIEGNLTISGTGSLTLANGEIRSPQGSINIMGGDIKIESVEPSSSNSSNYGIYAGAADITIGGDTQLDIKVENGYWASGIQTSNGSVHITGNSQVTIHAKDGTSVTRGISSQNKTVTVDTKGRLKITTEGTGSSAIVSNLSATDIDYIITGSPNEKDFEMVFAGIAANVSKISIKTPPKTDYGEGETLNLAGLVAVLHHPDTGLEEVSFENFQTRGITTSLPQGRVLTTADTQVVLSHTASGKTVSLPIRVVIEPLVFNHNDSFNVPEDEIGKQVAPISLISGLQGGKLPYTYEKEGVWPDWLDLATNTGIITGIRPDVGQAEMQIKVKVTDAMGQTAIIDLIAGAVHYKPIKIVPRLGESYYLDKEYPYFDDWRRYETKPGYSDYGHYDIYTRTLTLDKLSDFGGYFDVEQGHINIMIAEGTSYLHDGRIIADGDININGEGKLNLGYLDYMGNIWSKNGNININSGEIILQANDSTIHHGIRADKGSVTIGGDTKLDIYLASSGATNYGIYALEEINIVDRADVKIEVKNGNSNTGIHNIGYLNISTKSKLDIIASNKVGSGQNRSVYNNGRINVNPDDYEIVIIPSHEIFPHETKRSYTYKGDPSDVRAIKVKTLPTKTSYFVGQKLDLSGLVVTLEKEGVPDLDVSFANFAANGITVTPTNGSRLKATDTTIVFNHKLSGSRGEMPISINQTPLTFIYSGDYDIPIGEENTSITPVDISDSVFGGTGSYSYHIGISSWDKPQWLNINNSGVISGTRPNNFTQQTFAAIINIEDSAGNTVSQRIKVGGTASKAGVKVMGKELTWKKPYLLVGGEPTASGIYNAYFDACTRTLYLKNYVSEEAIERAIEYNGYHDLTIDLAGYNKFNGKIISTFESSISDLIFKGSGMLEITGSHGGIESGGNVFIKNGTIQIDLETFSENPLAGQKGIYSQETTKIEGDAVVDIRMRGNVSTYGIYGKTIYFAGNSSVGIDVDAIGEDATGFFVLSASTNRNVYVTTTNNLTVRENHIGYLGGSYNPSRFHYNQDLYSVVDEKIKTDLYLHSYTFKNNINDNAPYVTEIKVAKRPNQPIIYYNQILDLSGLEVELTDQYDNKTLVPLERFSGKGITTSLGHGSVFPDYPYFPDLVITHTDSQGNQKTVAMEMIKELAGVSVQGVSLNKDFTQIIMGNSEKLIATVTPSNATNKQLVWSSNNSSVASVDKDGNITAHAIGGARITVRTADGNKTATCVIHVDPPAVRVNGVHLSETNINLLPGETERLIATVLPVHAAVQTVEWYTSDSTIATVDRYGNIRAIAPGTATVTVTTNDGGYTKNCIVRVKGDGVSVSGEISFWDNQNNLVIKLYNATVSDADIREDMKNGTPTLARGDDVTLGTPAAAGGNKYIQTFSFEGVEDGTYKVAVYKPKYIAGIAEFTVTAIDINSLELLLWQRGDVNGDGKINSSDRQRLYEHLNGTKPLATEALEAADVNRDEKVNSSDRQRLYEHLNGTKPLT